MNSKPEELPDQLAKYRAAPIFSISLGKLTLLSLCTFGIYEWYWFLKQWDAEKRRNGESLSPVWRALFAPCYAFSLFRRLRDVLVANGAPPRWSPFLLGLAYLLLSLGRIIPVSSEVAFLSMATFAPLLFVQYAANAQNDKLLPELPRNDKYSGAELGMMVLGIAVQFLFYLLLRELSDLSSLLQMQQ